MTNTASAANRRVFIACILSRILKIGIYQSTAVDYRLFPCPRARYLFVMSQFHCLIFILSAIVTPRARTRDRLSRPQR